MTPNKWLLPLLLFLVFAHLSCKVQKKEFYHNPVSMFSIFIEVYGQTEGEFSYTLSKKEKHYLQNFDNLSFSDSSLVLCKRVNNELTSTNSIQNIEDQYVLNFDLSAVSFYSLIKREDKVIGNIVVCDFHISENFFQTTDTIILMPKYKKDEFTCVYRFRCIGFTDCYGTIKKTIDDVSTKEFINGFDFFQVTPDKNIKYEVFMERAKYLTQFIISSQ
jgi:hypothetical protein